MDQSPKLVAFTQPYDVMKELVSGELYENVSSVGVKMDQRNNTMVYIIVRRSDGTKLMWHIPVANFDGVDTATKALQRDEASFAKLILFLAA